MRGARESLAEWLIRMSSSRSLTRCAETEFGSSSRLADGGQILEARFSGEMCAIAKGSASILFESVEGRTVAAILGISDLQVLESLAGAIPKNRIQCALLPISALRGAVRVEGDRGPLT